MRGVAFNIRNLYRAAFRSITRKWRIDKKKPSSNGEPKVNQICAVADNNVPFEEQDGLIQDKLSMNGFHFQSFRCNSPAQMRRNNSSTDSPKSSSSFFKNSSGDGLFTMSCHNLTKCGTRSASNTPSRSSLKKGKTPKSCPASPENTSLSDRKSSTASPSSTPRHFPSSRKSSTDSPSTPTNLSRSNTPISRRSEHLSRSGPLSKSDSKRSTTIMFSNSSGMLKPPAIEKPLECSLEELCFGCSRKMKVTRAVVKTNGIIAQEEELVTINVKPGWKKGTKITFEGLGNERPGTYPADIIFVISEKGHPLFRRSGDDLELTLEIPLVQALTGCTISIPLLGGENMTLSIEDIIYPGYVHTIPDQGMAISGEEGKRGDLKVTFLVELPTSLTKNQKSDVLNILEDS